ncbi:MAG TPA: homoserine O-acetyltransferase [Candidatus Baltobacteraceae bacterium]|nr:homoserine O-acetyltransferase [Candidatus Baltobacteraceae bacterium]
MTEPSLERDVAIGSFALDCGVTLEDVVQRVSVYGEPRADGSNVVLVNHALTGSSRVLDWWGGLAGPGKVLDTNALAIVGINALGSCYGSTGPASPAAGGAPYGERFPVISVSDIVRAQRVALAELGIGRLAAVAGGSLGGMQALEWALQGPAQVERALIVGAYDWFSAMGIALNAVAREAIAVAHDPVAGIELARKIAILTYKSEALLAERFGRKVDRKGGDPAKHAADKYDVEGYLDYQGAIFSRRMEPQAYLTLTRAMDLFDTRPRTLAAALPALTFVGISSDWLFLPEYVRAAALRFAHAGADSVYLELRSSHGHDAFLAEPEHLEVLLRPRLRELYERLELPAAR